MFHVKHCLLFCLTVNPFEDGDKTLVAANRLAGKVQVKANCGYRQNAVAGLPAAQVATSTNSIAL